MKKLLLLRGVNNTGKSTAIINASIKFLDEEYQLRMPKKHEVHELTSICIEEKGKKICFASGSDQRGIIRNNADFFKKCQCDIAISAINPRHNKDWWEQAITDIGIDRSAIEYVETDNKDGASMADNQERLVAKILDFIKSDSVLKTE